MVLVSLWAGSLFRFVFVFEDFLKRRRLQVRSSICAKPANIYRQCSVPRSNHAISSRFMWQAARMRPIQLARVVGLGAMSSHRSARGKQVILPLTFFLGLQLLDSSSGEAAWNYCGDAFSNVLKFTCC